MNEQRFPVDNVVPVLDEIESDLMENIIKERAGSELLGVSDKTSRLLKISNDYHPLVSAVHIAFSQHRPLILTPDILWLTIAQGFALHINRSPEKFRHRFVKHKHKKTLEVVFNENRFPSTTSEWETVVKQFSQAINHDQKNDVDSILVPDFSTSSEVEKTIGRIVMMETMKQYYDYLQICICGIPFILLRGTVEDYEDIIHRTKMLAEYDLAWWTDELIPILEQFVAAANGNADSDFWQDVYKLHEHYGLSTMSGWIGKLFPYLHNTKDGLGEYTHKNPMLSPQEPRDEPVQLLHKDLPKGLSSAPVKVTIPLQEKKAIVQFIGGFVGIAQEKESLAIIPKLAWYIQKHHFFSLIQEIKDKHQTFMPAESLLKDDFDWGSLHIDYIPGELIEFYKQTNGAIIHNGLWHILPFEELDKIYIKRIGAAICFCKANNGISIYYLCKRSSLFQCQWSVACSSDKSGVITQDSPIIAYSIESFFEQILLKKDRLYFEDQGFVPKHKCSDRETLF